MLIEINQIILLFIPHNHFFRMSVDDMSSIKLQIITGCTVMAKTRISVWKNVFVTLRDLVGLSSIQQKFRFLYRFLPQILKNPTFYTKPRRCDVVIRIYEYRTIYSNSKKLHNWHSNRYNLRKIVLSFINFWILQFILSIPDKQKSIPLPSNVICISKKYGLHFTGNNIFFPIILFPPYIRQSFFDVHVKINIIWKLCKFWRLRKNQYYENCVNKKVYIMRQFVSSFIFIDIYVNISTRMHFPYSLVIKCRISYDAIRLNKKKQLKY